MKKSSKIFSIIMALIMVISVFPMSNITASAETYSGKCGDNLTWTFDDTSGTLTISGTGAMYDYEDYGDNRPWENYEDNIKKVVINNGVTKIGDYAFTYCDSLTSVTIPDSVTTIGDSAFFACYSLTSITIPDSVTTIGNYAFGECWSLTNIKIPNSVTTIGDYAFAWCEGLTSVTIPDSVTTIGGWAFFGCDSLTSVTIGDSVTTIGCSAFEHCESLTSVTIPDSVTTISDFAFFDCYSLTSVTIPDSVTTISDFAFFGCNSLTDVYYGGTEEEWNNISIGSANEDLLGATINFAKVSNPSGTCGENVTWEFDSSTGTLTISGTGEMDDYESSNNCPCNCPWESYEYNIKKVVINNGVTTVGNYAFDDLSGLKTVIIPDSVTTIGDYAFSRCPNITSITIPDSVTTIGNYAFTTCANLKSVTIGNGVTEINSGAFAVCHALLNITIPDSVTTIGERAFRNCSKLTSITIPDSVTTIGPYAFKGCSNLSNVYYTGTEKQWNEISFELGNEDLLNATIHYNHTPTFTGIKDDYFYKDDVKQKAYQLVEFNGDFYFINDYHKIAKNKRIYLSERFVEGFTFEDGTPLHVGYYDFDEEGKMIIINGVVGDYFYKNGVVQKAYQLVKFNNSFYFINDSHKVAKNKRIYLSQNFVEGFTYADGTPLKVGYYEFDENGKMVILDGPVGDYFYKNNVRLNAYQLVKYKGDYYFINDSHKLAKNKRLYMSQRFVEGTDLKVGYYEFDADGKLIIE